MVHYVRYRGEETDTHITFECTRYADHRVKAGNPTEWKDLDNAVWVTAEGTEKYDGVLDLFWRSEDS